MTVRGITYISFILLMMSSLFASNYVAVHMSPVPYVDEDRQLQLALDLQDGAASLIRNVRVYYKEFTEPRFQYQWLEPAGFRYLASVDLSGYGGQTVEYYIDIEYQDGSHQYYPQDAPNSNTMTASLEAEAAPEDNGILIISPEPGEDIFTDEFVLTASYFPYSSRVDKSRARLFLDNYEISQTSDLAVFDDFLTYSPKRILPGKHTIRLELFDHNGRPVNSRRWQFNAHQRTLPVAPSSEFDIKGEAFLDLRQEELGVTETYSSSRTYNRAGLILAGGTKRYAFGSRLQLSNQARLLPQPVNRYNAWIQSNFWNGRYVRLTAGDTYPQLNSFLIQNIPVRGVYTQLFLKFINLEATIGQTRRAVEGSADSSGTYQRNLLAMRGSFGARQRLQLGFTFEKSNDDIHSITLGGKGEANVGVGNDLYFAVDNKRTVLEVSANASLYNPNIGDGTTVSRQALQDAGIDITDNIYEFATRFMTVNSYMLPDPSRAYQARLRLSYFNNNLSIQYRSVDENFFSLGQPYLLRDTRGVSISDNMRLFSNQVFLNLRFQQYDNNLADNKMATTTNRNLGFNVSYFPLRNLPSINFGYNNFSRNNGLAVNSESIAFPENNLTSTINFSSSFPFSVETLKNRLNLNFLIYSRTDNINTGANNVSNIVSLFLQTLYKIPLKSHVEFTFQQTENTALSGSNRFLLNTIGGGLEYSFKQIASRVDGLTAGITGRYGIISSDIETTGMVALATDYKRSFLNGRLIYSHFPFGRFSINADWINYAGDRSSYDYVLVFRYDLSF